ncbi:hypothetical protein [Brachyspira sp. G79]|uniref:hypothetical protein n=1 Tax=Brachyspira sp. G79 TaxID=1358104 RepID=UPI000BBB8E31|nr:hypothetical protein [Brachyspira sp. G79]PCG20837.1 hypothetical protein KQ44_13255 [Brachyspira sp. G79]
MVKGFETNDNERAEAAYIIYALLKSRPENSSVNQSNQKFIDWGVVRRYIKKIFKKSETISEFIEELSIQIGVEVIDKKYIRDIDFDNNNLLKCLDKNTFAIIALLQQRFAKDSEDFSKKNIDKEE